VQDDTGRWVPLLHDTFVPPRNKKPNQLQSKTEQQKVGAQVPPPAGVNPPSVLQGPDQAQNAVNLKKPPKKLFDPASWPWWLRLLVLYVVLPLLALLALYGAVRGAKAWRRNRHARRGPVPSRIAWAWDDLMSTARSYGQPVPRRATRLEQAAALQRVPAAAALAAQANALVFGPGDPTPQQAEAYWAEVNQARTDLRAHCDWWRRLLADIDVRPLLQAGPHRERGPASRTLSFPFSTRRAPAS
jgi:hypothetical protein